MILSIIIPVYNERPYVERLIRSVVACRVPPHIEKEIIAVNDGSDDGTEGILERLAAELPVRVLHHSCNQGKGAALRTGLARASGHFYLFQDADLEYEPRDYALLLAPLIDGSADVVYGSRFLHAHNAGIPFLSRTANRILSSLSNWVTGLRITDMESGYKVFRREALQGVSIEEDGFGVEPELTAKVAKRIRSGTLRMTEVAVQYTPRQTSEGKKIRWYDAVWAVFCIVRYGFSHRER